MTKKKSFPPTVEQINTDELTKLANQYWAPNSTETKLPFNPEIIGEIYHTEICQTNFSVRKIMLLEFSQYLENYLWPNYDPLNSSHAHVMSIVIMVNEKSRERIPPWEVFSKKPQHFQAFFRSVLKKNLDRGFDMIMREHIALLVFTIHAFSSVEVDLIRVQIQPLVSFQIWTCLLPERRDKELSLFKKYKKDWKRLLEKNSKLSKEQNEEATFQRFYLYNLIQKNFSMLDTITTENLLDPFLVQYCERFLELLIDLEALLHTRRFFNVVLDDCHVVIKCSLSHLLKRPEGKLFSQLLEMLKFYAGFEINNQVGKPLTDHKMMTIHYDKIMTLQRISFKHFPELRRFSLSNIASVDTKESLFKHFSALSKEKLHELCSHLALVPKGKEEDKDFLLELITSKHERRISQLEALNEMPLYPTEDTIWNENIVPTEYFSGEGCLALPKLNLQFLTLHDYLLRNFNLFRLESTYEIRQDIEDAVFRLKPWGREDGGVHFGGWARMAQPINQFTIVEVAKPNIGEKQPSRVRADITVNLNVRSEIKSEWESLRKHDVCFLLTVRPKCPIGTQYRFNEPFIPQVGLTYIRGCEIEGMVDITGRVVEEGLEQKPNIPGDKRTYRVFLDCNQYRIDMENVIEKGQEDIYESFNIILRRKPKENNFKAVLETIRNLMNTNCVVPDWLQNIILGYEDPSAAHYDVMPNKIVTLDFYDTFLSWEHLKKSFPEHEINCKDENIKSPFKLTFGSDKSKREIVAESYKSGSRGPYIFNEPKRNSVEFTPTQIEAIRSGMQPGLTLVVGPPGTGKTDVAVQIISNLYHNFPEQRTLIVTHSNQALNQLFEKIMALDIDERHLLRLGHGEESLETEKDFSRYGRVNYVLLKRMELLRVVQKLQESLGVPGDVAYTCETAGHFYLYQILARWEEFLSKMKSPSPPTVAEAFPFGKFFSNAPQPLFHGKNSEEDMDIAEGCFYYIKRIFDQLEEFRAFELLRTGLDRSKYLLVHEAKIIAMTCTHAALKRKELVELGFKYDNVLMEEAAQILEIETFIPLLLQNPQDGYNRLKRWIMIGDHHQLPPVIKNMAFQKYSNMEQSLFRRFVRLGVPTIDLDAQGRARPSICRLYNWRYKKLGDLAHVLQWPEYRMANAGFLFDYQLINVEDFNNVGESEPNPYFYQNLAEAEYCVATFMYMRMMGYPAEKISILTTYNGQKHLIRDVLNERCGKNPLIGKPSKVTTVDKYQGQQNDYILLSLVRTKVVGHLRDVRRLVVAMSRARLGLYVFARVRLFENCFELQPSFNLLTERPLKLHLVPNEMYPNSRKLGDELETAATVIEDMPQMANYVYQMYQQRMEHLKGIIEAEQASKPEVKLLESESSDDESVHEDDQTEKAESEEKAAEKEVGKKQEKDMTENGNRESEVVAVQSKKRKRNVDPFEDEYAIEPWLPKEVEEAEVPDFIPQYDQ
ncbi:hypothetical protein CHUAL_009656 [Chamberlinius hualienensis]